MSTNKQFQHRGIVLLPKTDWPDYKLFICDDGIWLLGLQFLVIYTSIFY